MNASPSTRWLACLGSCLGLLRAAPAQQAGFVPLPIDGITGVRISSFAMDRQGALWMGSDRGLLRFDGSTLEQSVSEPGDPFALPSDAVYEVLAAADGRILAATAGGAFVMDPVNGRHHPLLYQPEQGQPRLFECLSIANSATGHWAFGGRLGLMKLYPGDSTYRLVNCPQGAPQRATYGWEAPDGSLWYSDRHTLRHLDPHSGTETLYPCRPFGEAPPGKALLLRVIPDIADPKVLWCTSWGMGLLRFDMRTGTFTPFARDRSLSDLWNICRAAVQEDSDHWILTLDNGLWRLDTRPQEGHWYRLPDAPQEPTALFLPRDGNLICGGLGEVLMRPVPLSGFTMVKNDGPWGNRHVTEASDGSFWAVQYYSDRKLLRFNAAGRLLASIPFPQDERHTEPFQVLEANDGTIWMATTRGLWRHVPGTPRIDPFPLRVLAPGDILPVVLDLYKDPVGHIWSALGGQGLVRLDPVLGSASRIEAPEGTPTSATIGVSAFDERHVLVVQQNMAPWIVDLDGREATTISGPELPPYAFADIQEVLLGRDGALYTCHRAFGLKRLKRDAQGHWNLDREWYLPARPSFHAAEVDGRGRIWTMSDRGAHLLDPATDILHPLDALHGVPYAWFGLVGPRSNGGVLLSSHALLLADPAFEPQRSVVELVLRKFTVNGIDRTPALLGSGPLQLAHDQNDISLVFGCIALLEGDAFRYSYRLVKQEEPGPWTSLGAARALNLFGLGAGDHRIDIRAEGPSTPEAFHTMAFTVLPAWWATWWARTFMVLLTAVLIVLATRAVLDARHRRALRELESEREVQRVRMRISRDIHDGIGSGLTKITMMSRQLNNGDTGQAERIAKASTELVNELGEIVWTVDPRNDSYSSFVAYVRNMLGRWSDELKVELRAELHMDPSDAERMIGPEVKRNVLLVLKEAVNNALKHSGADRITVELDLRHDRVHLAVSDNGRGFDPENVRREGNGLVNFRKRAELLQGQCTWRTGAAGTTVELDAPIIPTNM